MTTADDRWDIDIKPALAALKRLRDSIGKTDKKAAEGFDRSAAASKQARDELGRFIATGTKGSKSLGGALGALTSPLGAVTAGVGALSAAFVALAAVATKTFIDVTAGGIALNKEAEITRIALVQIFEGNEKAADAFINTIGDLATELGTSRQELTGFAKGILPDVGTVGGTAELLKNVIVLGKDAGAQIDDIRRTLEGALVGDFVGFQDVLNIPPPTIKKIKVLAKEIGNAEAITAVLGDRIQDQGLSIEAFADTLDTLQNKLEAQFQNFQKILGGSPFEELKEEAQAFLVTLDEQEDNIGFVAEAFGDLAANVIDFVGSGINEFIAALDFEAIERLVDSFNLALSAGQLVLDVLFELPDTQAGIDQTTIALIKTQGALEKVAELAAKAKLALQATVILTKAAFQISVTRDFLGAIETLKDLGDVASLENQEEAAKNTEAAFERYEQRIRSINEAQEERRDTSDDATQADLDAGEAVLANKIALDELADAQAKAAKAQAEISEKQAAFAEELGKKLIKTGIRQEEERTEVLLRQSEKREAIELKSNQNREKALFKFNQDVAALPEELSKEEAKVAREAGRKRVQIDTDASQARIDVERNLRQELQNIQRQFNQSAQDAERTNDAQAFLQAKRARDTQVKEAEVTRDVSLGDVGREAEVQREALKVELASELEDVRVTNRQKVADLEARLNKELELQEFNRQKEAERQALAEQQETERLDRKFQLQAERQDRAQAEKEAKLNESLETQFALIEAAVQKELELLIQTETEKTKIVAEEMERRARALRAAEEEAAQTSLPPLAAGTGRRPNQPLTPMAEGSDIAAGQTALVGEKGMELFAAPTAGRIIPNQAMFSPPASPGLAPSNVNNSRNLNVEQLGINPGDGILSRMVQNEVSKMLELLG